jgi:hypothetical protein
MLIDGMDIVTPQWLVSVSGPHGQRPNNNQLAMVRRDFGMREAEEDNHEPGIARKLFLIVDLDLRRQHAVCACKTDETVHVEPDGYRWSQARRWSYTGQRVPQEPLPDSPDGAPGPAGAEFRRRLHKRAPDPVPPARHR